LSGEVKIQLLQMVEPTFLVGLAIVFLFLLVVILRNSGSDSGESKKDKQKRQPTKEKKQKVPKRNSLKKEKRPVEVKQWTGIDTAAKDAQEMLEFLKGKDPIEIAKLHVNQTKQQNKKKQGKKPKTDESQSSEDSTNDEVINEEGFSVITKKQKSPNPPSTEKKKKQKKDNSKNKAFFKDEVEKGQEKENRNSKRKAKSADNSDAGVERRKKQPEGDQQQQQQPKGEKKERQEGEKRERKERKRERSEGEEGEKQKRQYRKPPPTVPPNVKYEQADLDDILNSITQDYKPKPKTHRIPTVFSKIPRNIILTFVSKLEAKDLLSLSEVNHYFIAITRTDFLWKDLLLNDFGIRDLGKFRNFRSAYRGEYKRRKLAAKKKKVQETKEILPQDDAKDTEKPKTKQEKKSANEAVEQAAPTKEQEKTEDQ